MKSLNFALFLCLSATHLQAQKAPVKFGDVPMEQLKMTRYGKDSSASAVVLADYGESTVEYNQNTGFSLNFQRIRRIKILTKDGLKWADFTIGLYHSDAGQDEKIQNLKAVTYNLENGKIIESKVKSEAIFKENYDAHTDRLTVTWPNVKEGSVIEISYGIKSDFLFNFQDWEFQETIPTVWSEYRARIPEYYNYDKYMQGYIPLFIHEETQVSQSIELNYVERTEGVPMNGVVSSQHHEKIEYQENRFRWVSKDVPAFKSEPYMTTYLDYISKINFELAFTKFPNQAIKNYMGSWDDINKLYTENSNFGGEVTGNGFLKSKVEEITKGLSSQEEKLRAIFNYVKANVNWDGLSRTFTIKSFKKVLEDQKGNSAEINLLLASMLEKADFAVSPVLLSTRDHGFLRESTPIASQFNYVICVLKLDNKSILLDATEKLLPLGALPERCLNGKGFVVSKEGYSWVDLQPASKSRTVISTDLSLAESGELKGKLEISRTGYNALDARKHYLKGESDYIKDFLGGRTWELTKNEFQNTKEIQQPFVQLHDLIINEHVTSAGDMLYLNPFILHKEDENPFKLENREYPVNFGSPFEKVYMIKINLPEGYSIEEVPKSKVLLLPENAAKYIYSVSLLGNVLTITSSMSINKSLFSQPEYPHLREFYNQVVAKQDEQIVVKRK